MSNKINKAWYRLFKVIFIFLIAVSFCGLNVYLFIYSGQDRSYLDKDKIKIECNYGDREIIKTDGLKVSPKVTVDLREDDFVDGQFDYEYYFSRGRNDDEVMGILLACYPNLFDLDIGNTKYDYQEALKIMYGYNLLRTEIDLETSERKKLPEEEIKKVEEEYQRWIELLKQKSSGYLGSITLEKIDQFDGDPVFFTIQPIYTYEEFIAILIISNSTLLLVLEFIRRIFFYITYGSFRSKKKLSVPSKDSK